jgi:hypothetical protein
MPDLADRLARAAAHAPARPPTFLAQLQRRIEVAERARRRRRAALLAVAAALVAAALAAGGVAAFQTGRAKTVDDSYTCTVQEQGGIPVVHVKAYAHYRFRNNGKTFSFPPLAGFYDRLQNNLGTVGQAKHGYGHVPEPLCTSAGTVPLARSGLPLLGVYRNGSPGLGGGNGGNGAECWVAEHVAIRLRIAVDKQDVPVSAQLMLRSGRKQRPVAFVEWTPARVTVYASDACSI